MSITALVWLTLAVVVVPDVVPEAELEELCFGAGVEAVVPDSLEAAFCELSADPVAAEPSVADGVAGVDGSAVVTASVLLVESVAAAVDRANPVCAESPIW